MTTEFPVLMRHATARDIPFLMSSYIRGLAAQSPWDKLDPNWHSAATHTLAERMLRQSVIVACDPEDPDQCFGWICFDDVRRVLYWIYVKKAYRQAGLGTALMEFAFLSVGPESDAIRITHKTDSIGWHTERWNLVYDSHSLVTIAK